jgi:soluble lytic murein transglycosylase-like protein
MATKDEIFAFAAQEAERQGVPLSLVQGVIEAESGGKFDARGPKTRSGETAFGPMQLMAGTAKDLGVNRMDWADNIRGGVKYLGQLSQRFSSPELVLAAYNAGPGNVERYGGVPPFKETQNYVKKVQNFMSKTTDDDFVPFEQATQQTTQQTRQAPAPQAAVDADDFVPFSAAPAPKQNQTRQTPNVTNIVDSVRAQANQPPSQFLQDVRSSFNPMDVLRGQTTTGQLAMGAGNLINTGIQNVLGSLGFSDEYLGRTRTPPAPAAPTQSISDIIGGVARTAQERPGLLVGGLGTALLDPLNLALPGGIQRSLATATPRAVAQAAPRTVAAAQNIGTAATAGGISSGAAQLANTGTINPAQLGNEMAAGALMAAPVAAVGAATTPRQVAPLTQSQQVAQQAIAQGATLPPTQVNPTILNRLLEGFSGKQQTGQVASLKNQEVINTQARKSLGLAPDTPITPQVLQDYRNVKGQAYDALRANPAYYTDRTFIGDVNKRITDLQKLANTTDVSAELNVLNGLKQLSFNGDGLVEQIKRLRGDAETNLSSGDARNISLGRAQKFASQQLEDLAERNLTKFNQPDVMKNFKQARQDIAKSYTIEKSLNAATGDVSGAKLGQRAAAGKIVPAELQAVSNAAAAFPTAFQNVARIGSVPGISPLDVGAAGIAAASAANPSLLATVAGRPLVRSAITSAPFQNRMLPNTTPRVPGLLNRITTDPLANYGIGMLPQYGVQ